MLRYKEELENSETIRDVQLSYENSYHRQLLFLKKEFPESFESKIILDNFSLWLNAEKFAQVKFGRSEGYLIKNIYR